MINRLRLKTILAAVAVLVHAPGMGTDLPEPSRANGRPSASGYCLDFGSALTGTDSTLVLTVVLAEAEPVRGFQFDIIDNTAGALVLRSVEPGEKVPSWEVPAVETPAGDVRCLGFGLSGEETVAGVPGVLLEVTFDIVGTLGEEVAFHFGGPSGVHFVTDALESLVCDYPDEDSPRVFPVDWLSAAPGTDALPGSFAMDANYPNPFNATTVIGYRVPRTARVDLTVYNLLGQKVTTLVASRKPAGVYRVSWDGRDDRGVSAASGIYLIVFRSGDFLQRGKMVLLR
ncbi:MAG: FlgD immunoglobulin-like domain containing protein [Fidelibacterota bacterium]